MAFRLVGNKFVDANDPQFQAYNTIGRDAGATSGDDNFFTKRWKSIDNAIGTTGASAVSAIDTAIENQNINDRLNRWNNSINDIYKKYGYEDADAYYAAKNAAEKETFDKYGYDSDNYWNKHAELWSPSGDNSDAIKALDDERTNIINGMSQEDADKIRRFDSIQNELINQSNSNSNEAKQASDNWRDYRENSDVGKRINQDRGKFLGSAVNTLSTATDLLGLTNGPLANAIQGGIEGVADELEQNGLENFDWGRAGQNALIGAGSGAMTGALNKGIDSALAKRGGKLFQGGNAITSGINNFNQNNGLGKLASTLGTGVARGALSGATGGFTGSGLSSALNGVEFGQGVANALQGAARGFEQGAVTGGVMAGANMVADKTPGVNRFMQNVNEAKQNWQNSGDSFTERLNNTRANNDTWGNRFLNNRIADAQAVKQGFKDVGEGLGVLPQTQSDVKSMSQDVQNMRINDGNQSPETAVYRSLAGEVNTSDSDLAYGESNLGNRTRRGMLADSLERFGNSLEGAQTNVTRSAAKDLGIESTGKVVENVRKKTGITNLETQGALAKELTGGENSLMDSVQRMALSASEDGQPYKVDTDPVLRDVESIVDKYADTNMFGSQTAKNRFISNLRRDISNYDSDILSIANRMKSNAADLRGKGVASPAPADAAKAKIYTEIASRLDDLSYKAIPQDNVDAMFDTTISEMRGRAKQATDNGNNDIAKAYNKLADSLDAEPRTVQAFRSFKKDFVDASKVNELTNRAENGAAAQMGRSFGGGAKRFLGTVAQRPVNAALAKAGGVINNIADKVAGDSTPTTSGTTAQTATSTSYNPATQVYNAIGRTEGAINADNARAANYISEATQDSNTLEDLATTAGTNGSTNVYNSIYGSPNATSTNPTAQAYLRVMSSLANSGNLGAASTLLDKYYAALYGTEKNKDYSDITNWSAGDRSDYLKAQNGLSQIKQLEDAYDKAVGEGGSNSIQGTFRQLANNISGGNLDPSASNYVKQAESIGAGIIKNLVNLGSTEYDAARYIDYLPKLTDTKEQAKDKLNTLYAAYENIINNLYSVYGM